MSSAASDEERPFRILGLQQVAVGAPDKERLRFLWGTLLGVPLSGYYESEAENVREDIGTLGQGPQAVEIDLMEPMVEGKRPDVTRPALNHIGLWVDHLEQAKAWLEARGVRFTPGGIRKGAAGHDVCFIHPKKGDGFELSGEGVLIELVQAPPERIAASEP